MKHKQLKGKKVLITGITGFIGSHLANRLIELGAEVYGISQNIETSTIIKGKILNFDFVNTVIKKKKIQLCFHLAGESSVEGGQTAPYQTFTTNIQGTLNILECARIHKLEKIIIASSSHVYGKNRLPYYEGYTPKPSRPYETSKACTDLVAQSYADTFKLPVIIPRFVNIYGPGDTNFNRIIPKFMKAIYKDKLLRIWGGEATRDYLYIDDAVNGYVNMAKLDMSQDLQNRIFNFGSGNVVSVKNLLDKIVQVSDVTIRIERVKGARAFEITSQYVSYKKAERILAWKPKVSLDEGLKKTALWYKDYFEGV